MGTKSSKFKRWMHLHSLFLEDGATNSLSSLKMLFIQLSTETQPEFFFSFVSQERWATTHQHSDRIRAFVDVDWNMGTMYNRFDHSKTVAMKVRHRCLIDVIALNPLAELGSCMSRQTLEWKKDEPIFSDTATLIAYSFGIKTMQSRDNIRQHYKQEYARYFFLANIRNPMNTHKKRRNFF